MPSAPPSTPAFRHVVHHLSDPDEFGVAVTGASLVADFLQPQRQPTRVEQFQTPGWALDFHEAHVKARVIGPLPPGWASFGLMRSPAESSWYGCPARRGVLACTPPGEMIDGHISPGFQCLAVNIPPTIWERGRMLAGVERAEFGSAVVHQLEPPLYARIEGRLRSVRQSLLSAVADPHRSGLAAREAENFAAEMAVTVWELGSSLRQRRESPRNRARLARRAEAWMLDHLSAPVQVPDVCLALRVSRRELEYAFRLTFDESPRDHLQALRLNAIRRVLLRGGADLVKSVALSHGITHLGRFSAHYYALFGEHPGATLCGWR